MNAIELLKADHDKVEELFEQVKANEDGDNTDVFKQIKAELDVHAHIEETVFYPRLVEKGDEDLKKITLEGIEEHTQVKTLLTELNSLDGMDDTFKAKLTVLMENVEHHVEEEEDEMFSLVEEQFEASELEELGQMLKQEKSRAMKSGSAKA